MRNTCCRHVPRPLASVPFVKSKIRGFDRSRCHLRATSGVIDEHPPNRCPDRPIFNRTYIWFMKRSKKHPPIRVTPFSFFKTPFVSMDVKYQIIFPGELIFEWRRIRLICFETFTRNPIFGSHFRKVLIPKTCHDICMFSVVFHHHNHNF